MKNIPVKGIPVTPPKGAPVKDVKVQLPPGAKTDDAPKRILKK